jgi:hypothetical protein
MTEKRARGLGGDTWRKLDPIGAAFGDMDRMLRTLPINELRSLLRICRKPEMMRGDVSWTHAAAAEFIRQNAPHILSDWEFKRREPT